MFLDDRYISVGVLEYKAQELELERDAYLALLEKVCINLESVNALEVYGTKSLLDWWQRHKKQNNRS